MCVRWKHRAYFVMLTVVGVAVAVGANPFDDPSILGGLFKSFAESSSFGLALRSTSRAVPLVALGLAVLLGVGVNALAAMWQGRGRQVRRRARPHPGRRGGGDRPRGGQPARALDRRLLHPGPHPRRGASRSTGPTPSPRSTRHPTTPASSRSPAPTSPPTAGARPSTRSRPGSWTGPYVARELVPWGSAASADLLERARPPHPGGHARPVGARARRPADERGLDRLPRRPPDRPLQPRARGAAVALSSPQPEPEGARHTDAKYGDSLGPPLRVSAGRRAPARAARRRGRPAAGEHLPGRRHAGSIVRSADASAPLIVSGDGEGLVDLASIGALIGDGVVLYSAHLRERSRPAAMPRSSSRTRCSSSPTPTASAARRWTSVPRRLRGDRARRPDRAGEGRERQPARRVPRRGHRCAHRGRDARASR